jgi:sortase B
MISCMTRIYSNKKTFLLAIALLLTLSISACGKQTDAATPPADVQIGYRRMFIHDKAENIFAPFQEAVLKSGSITVSTLDKSEDSGEGYFIYTFNVKDSLYNPDSDKQIHLYEGYRKVNGTPVATPEYEIGTTYLLILSRATDVYYEHPYFHNFNGIRIVADQQGKITEAVSSSGKENLLAGKTALPAFQTIDSAVVWIRDLLSSNTDYQKGTYRFNGRELVSEDPYVISEGSDYIATVHVDTVTFKNRFVQECLCTVTKPVKGIFGMGSGPDAAASSTESPISTVLPGNEKITVLFPASVNIETQKDFLVFLFVDGEYRITSKSSIIALDGSENAIRWMDVSQKMAGATEPAEEILPTPTPPPKEYIVQDKYKGFLQKNSDVRGWFKIADTVIDYPVLQTVDNDFYVSGSIILDFRVNIKNLTQNTPVYGHNMKKGTMFHALVNYKTKSFYEKHPTIEFNTLYDNMTWDVFSVYVVDSGYNTIITMDFKDDSEYQKLLDDISTRSMYPIPFEVTTDDKIITLVTCSYEFDGARTVVNARLQK